VSPGLNDGVAPSILLDMERPTRVLPVGLLLAFAAAAAASSGCRQVRGRKMIQDANELYKKGRYVEAVSLYERAEPLVPELAVLWLNKGYTCRQLLGPATSARPAARPGGEASAESRRWGACALDAFARVKQLSPRDPRGEQLYMQTLFDINDFGTLESIFLAQGQAAQRRGTVDLDAATGLQQVYFKQGKWTEALAWARKAADARTADADAQYRLGSFIWQLLSSRGGGNEMMAFDPRTGSAGGGGGGAGGGTTAKPRRVGPDDITGPLRIELADEGIRYLERALTLRPKHPEAMIYLNLLYRQKSLALFSEPDKWQAAIDKANEWQKKGFEARGSAAKL
jgi:tetratricopeptide (TPR) repeat protein